MSYLHKGVLLHSLDLQNVTLIVKSSIFYDYVLRKKY